MKASIIDADWLGRSAAAVGPDLLGCRLVRRIAGEEYRGTIVETEAYDATDPACHGYHGKTDRNAAIFGAPGSVYVYLIYGIYHCINIVTDRDGFGSAVLLRALLLDKLPPNVAPKGKLERLAAGPGKLCRALHIDCRLDGARLRSHSELWLEPRSPTFQCEIVQTTRVGITKGAEIPWRWYIRDHPAVSKK